jgi:hypothetical protein
VADLDDGPSLGDELAERADVLVAAAEAQCIANARGRALAERPVSAADLAAWIARQRRRGFR